MSKALYQLRVTIDRTASLRMKLALSIAMVHNNRSKHQTVTGSLRIMLDNEDIDSTTRSYDN